MWIAYELIQDSPSAVEFHDEAFATSAAAEKWISTQERSWAWAVAFIAIPEAE